MSRRCLRSAHYGTLITLDEVQVLYVEPVAEGGRSARVVAKMRDGEVWFLSLHRSVGVADLALSNLNRQLEDSDAIDVVEVPS